jgi:hypothetical protein
MLDESPKPTDPRVDPARNRTSLAGFRTQLTATRK